MGANVVAYLKDLMDEVYPSGEQVCDYQSEVCLMSG